MADDLADDAEVEAGPVELVGLLEPDLELDSNVEAPLELEGDLQIEVAVEALAGDVQGLRGAPGPEGPEGPPGPAGAPGGNLYKRARVPLGSGTVLALDGGAYVRPASAFEPVDASRVLEARVVVTGQAGILSTSTVIARRIIAPSADHTADEHLVEDLDVDAGLIVPGVGFTIIGRPGRFAGRLFGIFNVAWQWS